MSLSAGGRWIAYADWNETSNVYALPIPTTGTASVQMAEPVTAGNQITEAFDVSPDGRWLAFDSDRSGNQDIYRAPMTGGEPERLTNPRPTSSGPSGRPTERRSLFTASWMGAVASSSWPPTAAAGGK